MLMKWLSQNYWGDERTFAVLIITLLFFGGIAFLRRSSAAKQYLMAALLSLVAVLLAKLYYGVGLLNFFGIWQMLHIVAFAYAASCCWCSRTGGGMNSQEAGTLAIVGLLGVVASATYFQKVEAAGLTLAIASGIFSTYYLSYGVGRVRDRWSHGERKDKMVVVFAAAVVISLFVGGLALLNYYGTLALPKAIGWSKESLAEHVANAPEGRAAEKFSLPLGIDLAIDNPAGMPRLQVKAPKGTDFVVLFRGSPPTPMECVGSIRGKKCRLDTTLDETLRQISVSFANR